MSPSTSSPRCGPVRAPGVDAKDAAPAAKPAPPKNCSKKSLKPVPLNWNSGPLPASAKSAPPKPRAPSPAAAPASSAAQRAPSSSYFFRLAGSPSTSFASLISLNFSSADGLSFATSG